MLPPPIFSCCISVQLRGGQLCLLRLQVVSLTCISPPPAPVTRRTNSELPGPPEGPDVTGYRRSEGLVCPSRGLQTVSKQEALKTLLFAGNLASAGSELMLFCYIPSRRLLCSLSGSYKKENRRLLTLRLTFSHSDVQSAHS